MKDHIAKIIIAKDGWPLEQFKGCPITNFFRRLLYGRYKVCEICWRNQEARQANKNNIKEEKKIKFTEKEWEIVRVLTEEMVNWESTEKVSLEEFTRLVKRLNKI